MQKPISTNNFPESPGEFPELSLRNSADYGPIQILGMTQQLRPIALLLAALAAIHLASAQEPGQPNVILVLTDDQGLGDLSFYGNPVIQTPNLDKLARQGVSFDQFHVTSMCSPTRAAMLTGLDPLANGTISTCQGLSVLRPEHPVMSESFAQAGYATGLFGKWHLGANWPSRPQDRGFQENYVLHGYGPTGVGSRWNNDYIDTWVTHNGVEKQGEGFCTDIFFNQAMEWIAGKARKGQPFFALIATNAPHFPFWAPEEWTEPYRDTDNPEFFAMVKNIDDNMGRLMAFLRKENLEHDTILIFLSDNGAVGGLSTWNAGMTGGKASPWEGGHRVPLFIRYPAGEIAGGRVVRDLANIIDLYPTLIEICSLDAPQGQSLPGISLVPAMLGQVGIPRRNLYMHIQQHTLDPRLSAIMSDGWRLLWGRSLFNVDNDLAQTEDIAERRPGVFTELWRWYNEYYHEHREYATTAMPQVVGSRHQPRLRLDSSMWIQVRADGQNSVRTATSNRLGPEGGHWMIEASRAGTYAIALRRWPIESGLSLTEAAPPFDSLCAGQIIEAGVALPIAQASLDINGRRHTGKAEPGANAIRFQVHLDPGVHKMHGIFRDTEGNPLCGSFYAYIDYLGPDA